MHAKFRIYFYNINGNISKTCINYCNDWISEDNTTCTTKCSYLNQLNNLLTHKCVTKCPSNLFYNPELMTCGEKCKEPYKYHIDYKNNTKKCVKKCDEIPYLVEDEDNFECLPFNKFKIMSIESNSTFYLVEFPKYLIKQGNINNFTLRVNFNQNIRKRISLINGTYERIPENNNSIIINIETLKEKQIFIFKDNVDNSYDFGFEVELKYDRKDIIILVFIILLFILIIVLIIIMIKNCYCKSKKNIIDFEMVNDSLLNLTKS